MLSNTFCVTLQRRHCKQRQRQAINSNGSQAKRKQVSRMSPRASGIEHLDPASSLESGQPCAAIIYPTVERRRRQLQVRRGPGEDIFLYNHSNSDNNSNDAEDLKERRIHTRHRKLKPLLLASSLMTVSIIVILVAIEYVSCSTSKSTDAAAAAMLIDPQRTMGSRDGNSNQHHSIANRHQQQQQQQQTADGIMNGRRRQRHYQQQQHRFSPLIEPTHDDGLFEQDSFVGEHHNDSNNNNNYDSNRNSNDSNNEVSDEGSGGDKAGTAKRDAKRLKRESSSSDASGRDNLEQQSLSAPSSDLHPPATNQLTATRTGSTSSMRLTEQDSDKERACRQIDSLWQYLRSMYPTLARHLFEWSQIGHQRQTTAATSTAASDYEWRRPYYVAKSLPAARAVGHLLDEAERVLRNDVVGTEAIRHLLAVMSPVSSSVKQQPMSQSASTSSAWLARVYQQSPAYAQIIQRLRANNQEQQAPPPSPVADSSAAAAFADSNNNVNGLSAPTADGQQQQQHGYGRVAHYPHELAGGSGGSSALRTIEKLRLINKQTSDSAGAEQQRAGGGIGSKTAAGANELDSELESNRIASASQQQSSAISDTDLLRDRFVYGNVVLKQKTTGEQLANIDSIRDNNGLNLDGKDNGRGRNGHGQSMQMLKPTAISNSDNYFGNNNNNNNNNHDASDINNGNNFDAKDESYGRVLVGPQPQTDAVSQQQQQPTDSDINHMHHFQYNTNNNNYPLTHPSPLSHDHQQHHMKPSSLDRLKQQLDQGLTESGIETGANVISSNAGDTANRDDEMNRQHYGNTVGVNPPVTGSVGAIASGFVDDSSADFEGFFHSGPLQQIQVRHLRNNNNEQETNNQQQRHTPTSVRQTTSDPHDIFVVD